ncbi:FG-GAP repeat domain-containing protein [Namhaeicola litoreus]
MVLCLPSIFLFLGCAESKREKQVRLYESYCASCHILPSPDVLPRQIWEEKLLPDMAARMGIVDNGYNPLKGLPFKEAESIIKSGIYPAAPIMSSEDWSLLKSYILEMAPDSLPSINEPHSASTLQQFRAVSISLDENPGNFVTYFECRNDTMWIGDLQGNLFSFMYGDIKPKTRLQANSAVVDFYQYDGKSYITAVGKLDPSDIASGQIILLENDSLRPAKELFHRPVNMYVKDLTGDNEPEFIISEFGNLTGQLSLVEHPFDEQFKKTTLLPQPGTIKVEVVDLNRDNRLDIVALTSQGDETITVLYQQEDHSFIPEKVLRFSPIYGSSWFELIDYDKDGDLDIVTVNGDNADKTFVHKPYHGLRIHLNDGNNHFEEKYFYPLNGATRFTVDDFDQDGDFDFGIISTFPDYEKYPEYSFVYLENTDSNTFTFSPAIIQESIDSRWFLLDKGDIDKDGDLDIILSSFTYTFTPVPKNMTDHWREKNTDLLILENKLF